MSKWVGQIPEDVVKDMAEIAPMLGQLGYDPNANPPDYGKPDSFVIKKMQELEKNKEVWRARESEAVKLRESIRTNLLKEKVHPSACWQDRHLWWSRTARWRYWRWRVGKDNDDASNQMD